MGFLQHLSFYSVQNKFPRRVRLVIFGKSSLSGDLTGSRHESPRTSSSSSVPRSRGSLDPAFGIHLDRGLTDSPGEIHVAEAVEIRKPSRQSPVIYPELDRYRDIRRPSYSDVDFEVPFRLATHDLPPPTPASLLFSGTSGSPSTRFSESPGPGSYSRDTTPTSICSQSPGLVAPFRINQGKGRLNSPSETRPPVTRRRAGSFPNEFDTISADPQGLAAVRESLTSSSSNSTVREVDRSIKHKKSKRLPPPPPSPPPRKSSQKFRQNLDEISPEKPTRNISRSAISSPPPEIATMSTRHQPTLSPRATPPSRPSRDGTPDIQSQLFDPVPIIHSNLSTQSLPFERRGSEPTIPSSLPRSNNQYPRADRNASTSRLPTGKELASVSQTASAVDAKKNKAELPRLTRTPSPNVTSTFNTRFPFFSRKKTSTEGTQADKKEKDKKANRKGPAAGTGHEGYGRIGAARRRSGSVSNFARGSPRSQTSQESLTNHDPFLADRINPVIIAGGEIIENRNASSDLARTESSQSLTHDQPKVSSDMSSSSRQSSRNTLWPSAMARTPYPAPSSRRPSDSSDSEGVTMKSTLAFRRSVQRLRSSPEDPLRLPLPINTSGNTSSPMTSFDTSVMSDESHFELQRAVSREKSPVHPAPKKLVKRSRSPRKWNLFSRSQNQPASKKGEKVAATVKPVEKKPVAFYMMDSSEQEDSEPMDVQEVLRRANVFGDSPNLESSPERKPSVQLAPTIAPPAKKTPPQPIQEKTTRPQPVQVRNTTSQPPQVKSTPAQPSQPRYQGGIKPSSQRPALASRPVEKANTVLPTAGPSSSGRPSRLPQVGRIPKVVSNRPEHVSPKSFSRPFRRSLNLVPQPPVIYDVDSIAKGPTPPKPSTPVPELTSEGSTIGSGTNISSSRGSFPGVFPELSRTEKEFLAFSPRKDSDGTIGTSSSSCTGIQSFSGATAVIPNPNDPPAEDEVWDEYDDLLGEDSQKHHASASSSKGIPFHLETYQSKLVKEKPMESPTIVIDDHKVSRDSKATTRSSSYSADMTERLRTAFQPHPSPSTPFSVSEFVSGYGKRNNSMELSQMVENSPRSSRSSRRDRKSDASSNSDDSSPLAQVNLRVGSMTVSKWLTFGHVLFSDVRHDLVPVEGSLKRHSILVIDGLGNDDWSFYAAETYPAATFFNLSPRAPLPTELQNSPSSFPLSPPNHHQIQYVSHLEKFPFAPQSFTSVVYRFPVAAPESYYRNILTEARRVLKPGGYIEMSILDVDLNNMGNRGRRTVRRLKEGINEKTPETNLASTADLIVRLLGKVGFLNIKAARVGVPVASAVAHPDNSKDKGKSPEASKKKKDQPSLAEMMSDNSPLADEGITQMVSRVGRWWYTRCYESAAESPNDKSIWNDKSFMHECEELGTSLKLMVCCARAPDRITSF
ncbi:Fc.00g003810.m01.CDS01 [Cosmosporella sp. VM-42]